MSNRQMKANSSRLLVGEQSTLSVNTQVRDWLTVSFFMAKL